MPESDKRTAVKIKQKNLDAINALAKDLDMTAANIVDLCIEDCLEALQKKPRRPITPRIVKLQRVLKRQK